MSLTITKQCELLDISRSAFYYAPREYAKTAELSLLQRISEILSQLPFYGYRKVFCQIGKEATSEKKVRRIMRKYGLKAIFPGKNLSKPHKSHKKFPYLLKNMPIWLPNQVWATDITYVKVQGQSVYLLAILDLFSRKVLSWRLSNTLSADFCVDALEDAIRQYGVPAIFNTDQGSQFTSEAFTGTLQRHGIRISMDSVGRAADNIFVERLWRSVKYEDIYLRDYSDMKELKDGLRRYFTFYNSERFHQSLDYQTPDDCYYGKFSVTVAA